MRLVLTTAACLLVTTALAEDAAMSPGFDCAKAQSKAEKTICDAPGTSLAFMDRQLNKVFGLVSAAADGKGKAALKAQQLAFIKARDKCGEDYECLDKAYRKRLDDLAGNPGPGGAVGFFESSGELVLAIYPDGTAAVSALTVGGGGHTCAYESDDGIEQQDGTYRWQSAVDMGGPEPAICSVSVTPAGNTMTLATEGDGCSYYCGMRAILDGEFTRSEP